MARLVERGPTTTCDTYHMDGQWNADGTAMTDAIVRVLGDWTMPVGRLPWCQLRIAALVATTPRELMEMRYV